MTFRYIRIILFVIVIILFARSADADSGTVRVQKLALLSSMALIDYYQSNCIINDGGFEANPLLSSKPSNAEYLTFGLTSLGLTWLLSEMLPERWSTVFLDSLIETEKFNIEENDRVVNDYSRHFHITIIRLSFRW